MWRLADYYISWKTKCVVLIVTDSSISGSYNDKIFRKIRLEIREKFHYEILEHFGHSKNFDSVNF